MFKVGIIGVGTIGFALAKQCLDEFRDDVRLVGVVDIDAAREKTVRRQLGLKRRFTTAALIAKSDLIIEAAWATSAYAIARMALSQGKDVMLMSAGGIINQAKHIHKLAEDHRCCVYLPSGAIAGLDGLKSAMAGKVLRVELTTRKPPLSLRKAPYVIKHRIDLNLIKGETLLFDGCAADAITGFPQNINISATLSLAGLGPKKTRVKIYACPGLSYHVHEVLVEGEFGSLYTRTQNLPSKENPRTSHLAILSATATLRRILSNVKVGT